MMDPGHNGFGAAGQEADAINRQLATLLDRVPADLARGAEVALADELVICGVLGGKDVGKSTLINALAEAQVSADASEVGRGTDRPIAYVHEAQTDAVEARLHAVGHEVDLQVCTHQADAIRNVVLLDLPDFDSEFADHLDIVRRAAPLLDRVLWVLTPKKIGDRAWVSMLHDVIKDTRNVHCVLNKTDELLSDVGPLTEPEGKGPDAFWQEQHAWVAQIIHESDCPHEMDHRFLVAAAFGKPEAFVDRVAQTWDDPTWSRYAQERQAVTRIAQLATGELARLRSIVLGPITADEVVGIKQANRQQEDTANRRRIAAHYDLPRLLRLLADACDPDYHQQAFAAVAGPTFSQAVADNLSQHLRRDAALADLLLERRVERWPLLRLVHWPFGWLSRLVGRQLAGVAIQSEPLREDPFRVDGQPLVQRVRSLRSRILADHAVITRDLQLESELPPASDLADRTVAAGTRLTAQLEARLLDDIQTKDRRPSFAAKSMLWLICLWFPFIQPALEGFLHMTAEGGPIDIARGALTIVTALSASHLLASFGVVAAIFVMILAGMYVRALRAVRRAREATDTTSPIRDAVDELMIHEIVLPLIRPFDDRLGKLTTIHTRLEA